jgi:hypothetical protein
MVPILILLGVVFGRWWRTALAASALGWPILLVATDVMDFGPELLGAAGVAILNAGAGVLIHQGILRGYRRVRSGP